MTTTVRLSISIILIAGGICLSGHTAVAAESKILPPPTRVTEHLYAWIGPHGGPSPQNKGFRMNLAFVVG